MNAYGEVQKRGPRWAVSAGIRSGESLVEFYATAELAEQARERLIADGFYQVQVWPPEGAINLAVINRNLAAARTQLAEQMDIARAAANRAAEERRPEAAIARELGVDRMTVRKWIGK